MSGRAPLLEIRALAKRYGRVPALRNLDLTVAQGSIYGFIGPNGAGKTTTIRILAGLVRPDRGRLRLGGVDLLRERTRGAKGLRTLVESPAFYPGLSGRENLRMFARLVGAQRQQVDALLEAVGLGSVASRPSGGYSLGMRQRLGIAQSLLGKPQLVVLDEPMNGLDPAAICLVQDLLRVACRERGISFLLSSHLLHDIERLCDRVGVLHRGRLVAEGSFEDLLSRTVSGFRLRTGDDDRAFGALVRSMGEGNPRREDDGTLRVDGDEAHLERLHGVLLEAHVPPLWMEPVRDTLERWFLELTEGEMG